MSVEAIREASDMIPIEQIVAELEHDCQVRSRVLACDRALFPFVNRCLNLFEHQCDIVSVEGQMIYLLVDKKDKEAGDAVRGP
jgi:hypothetical protein